MDIANFHGSRSFLMVEAGGDGGAGGAGDGGGSTALAVTGGTDLATTGDTGADGDGTGGDSGAVAATTAADSEVFDKSGRMTRGASKMFRTLGATNPQAKALLARAERAIGAWDKVVGILGAKPIERINELRAFDQDARWGAITDADRRRKMGQPPYKDGATGLRMLRETAADMELSDDLYAAGDPKLIDMMTESPAGKQAFVKIFHAAVAKVRSIAPNFYTNWLGSQVIHLLNNLEIPTGQRDGDGRAITEPINMSARLRRIYSNLPALNAEGKIAGGTLSAYQQQEIQIDLGQIYALVEAMRSWSNVKPEDLTPPKEDMSAAKIAEAEKRADEAMQNAWRIQRDAVCNNMLDDEVRKQTKGMELSSTIIADITARARKAINTSRNARPDHTSKQESFLAAKNQAGYLAYHKKAVQDFAPEAVERAVALYGRKSSRRAPVKAADATAAGTGASGTQQTQQTAQAGQIVRLTEQQVKDIGGISNARWTKQRIGNSPGTTIEMLSKRQKMLKDGNPLKLPEGTVVQFP